MQCCRYHSLYHVHQRYIFSVILFRFACPVKFKIAGRLIILMLISQLRLLVTYWNADADAFV